MEPLSSNNARGGEKQWNESHVKTRHRNESTRKPSSRLSKRREGCRDRGGEKRRNEFPEEAHFPPSGLVAPPLPPDSKVCSRIVRESNFELRGELSTQHTRKLLKLYLKVNFIE